MKDEEEREVTSYVMFKNVMKEVTSAQKQIS